MRWLGRLRGRRSADCDLAEEIQQHLDEKADDLVRGGVPREEAVWAARRAFGNVTLTRERGRDVWRWRLVDDLASDVRYALRQLQRSPSFALAAVLTLAIGIGANTAIFSLADAALLNPLPFPHPERLVSVNEIVPLIGQRPIRLTAPDLVDFEAQSRSFDALGGWKPITAELSGSRESEQVQAVRATASLFDVLQVPPALGRTFTGGEDRDGVKVCVISDGLWRRWFGADPDVLGRAISLDRVAYRVIGVMPRGFQFPPPAVLEGTSVDAWVPMSLTPAERRARADSWDYNGVARLKPGVTIAQASADVGAIARHIAEDVVAPQVDFTFTFSALVRPLGPQVAATVRPLVLALLGAVACVLLIACVNVANLLLARGAGRQKEMAVRVALGAGRGRLLRQLLAEALLLATLAALAGGALAWWILDAMPRFVPGRFAALAEGRFDWRLLLFTAGVAVATAVVVGVVPGLAAGRGAGLETLADRAASSLGAANRRVRAALVVAEMALALVLLVGAGLFARTFHDVLSASPGFAPEGAVAGQIDLPARDYADPARRGPFYRDVLARLRARPHVSAAGLGTTLPLAGRTSERVFVVEGYTPPPGAGFNIAPMTVVTTGYLRAIGATLVRGRDFAREDGGSGEPVTIVSASLARRYWPRQDPIGRRLKWGTDATSPQPWLTVVGVVDDVKLDTLAEPGNVQIYMPGDPEEPSGTALGRSVWVVARGAGAVDALEAGLRDAVRGLDARLALAALRPLADAVSASAAPQRFNMLMMVGFAGMALLLAAIGIYGVVAYSVAQRTQEIGIRTALGADAGLVVRLIVREGLRLAGLGIAIGLGGAALLAPSLGALLYGVKPLDAPTFVAVALLLLAVAVAATYIPARRAARVDPTIALRSE